MKSPVIGVEVRWRPVDGTDAAEWTYKRFLPGQPVTLDNVVRGTDYDIELCNLGLRGTRSPWVALPRHTVASTNREGAAALPPVTIGNVSSRWISGTAVSYTATDTTATINVTAGTLQVAEKQIAYGASSAQVAGTASEVKTVWLYYDDPRLVGGTRTLGVTESSVTSLAARGRILIAPLQITFDVAGGTGTGGGGDIGGGGGGSGGSSSGQIIQ